VSLDITRAGSREYSPRQVELVTMAIQSHRGPHRAITVADLSLELEMDGRTIRQIIANYDGVTFMTGGGDDGLYACDFADQGEHLSNRLEAHARTELERVARRRAFAEKMPRQQLRLW
jgi:hypothetical protein